MRGKTKTHGSRRAFRLVGLPVTVLAFLAIGQVDVAPVTYAATSGEIQVNSYTAVDGLNRSEPLRITTTAVGLFWPDGGGVAGVRVSDDGTNWSDWVPLHVEAHSPDAGADEGDGRLATEAVFTGGAEWLQIQYHSSSLAPVVNYVDTSGSSLSFAERIGAQLARLDWSTRDQLLASPDQPEIQPRSAWGGDACVADDIHYHSEARAEVMFVHHTLHSANSNSYSSADVSDLLYAICSFHVNVRDFNDIGYNTLIDSTGRIWEGRGGGIDQPVRGAHAAGFNSTSIGVAFIGDHAFTPPTQAAQDAFVTYGAWRLDLAHVNPYSRPVVVSVDSPTVPDGVAIELRAIAGHRDVSTTSCPGTVGYNLIGTLTDRIAQVPGPRLYGGWPTVDPVPGNQVEGYDPTNFSFQTTSESDWRFVLTGPDGAVILEDSGVGTEGSVDWAPDVGFEWGQYNASVVVTPTDGSLAPRPASFTFTLGDFSLPFFDDEDSALEWAIDQVAAQGITSGCADLQFCPLGEVERWQMALFLARSWTASGQGLPVATDSSFLDVTDYPPETVEAISQLAAIGITSGISETEYAPELVVSRWQMALFLSRFLNGVGYVPAELIDPGFGDLGNYGQDVHDAVASIFSAGITIGTSETTFDPDSAVSREQMAAFIARAIATIAATESPQP